jgi:hypothetical protein
MCRSGVFFGKGVFMLLKLHPVSFRFARNVVSFFILLAVILLAACQMDDGNASSDNPSLNGTWISAYDGYIIDLKAKILEYDDGFGGGYDGNIIEIKMFNNNSTVGIIFIKYISKPYYYGTDNQPAGDYIGIYFRKLTDKQGEFAPPSTNEDWIPAKSSLEEAKNTFTEGEMGSFVSFWSVCIKQ